METLKSDTVIACKENFACCQRRIFIKNTSTRTSGIFILNDIHFSQTNVDEAMWHSLSYIFKVICKKHFML